MTEATWFALIAVAALAGWATTLVAVTKATLPAANAHKVLQAIIDREDTKVATLVERIERVRNRGAAPEPAQQRRPEREEQASPMTTLFGPPGPTAGLIFDQPDANADDLEVVS